MKRQLFIMDREMLALVGQKELQQTWEDMVEMGIARPPYESYTIQVPLGAVIRSGEQGTIDEMAAHGDERAIRLQHAPLQVVYAPGQFHIQVSDHTHKHWKTLDAFMIENARLYPLLREHRQNVREMATHIQALLIVMLATKNVTREVSHNRLARHGLGKQQYEYVTTLKLGVLVEDDGLPSQQTGMTKRPHLRRGHIRRQHYGPGLTYIKKVFIEPIFVNGWMPDAHDDRRAYNVSLSRKEVR